MLYLHILNKKKRWHKTSKCSQVKSWKLTGEGEEVVQSGSHEARLFNLVPAGDGGIEQAKLMGLCGKWGKIGFSKAMSAGWITIDKSQVLLTSSISGPIKQELRLTCDR